MHYAFDDDILTHLHQSSGQAEASFSDLKKTCIHWSGQNIVIKFYSAVCYFNQSQYIEWYLIQSHTLTYTQSLTFVHLAELMSKIQASLRVWLFMSTPPNDKQLGIILSIVEATGSMGVPTHWPRGSLKLLKFGPLLGKLKCNRLHYEVYILVVYASHAHLNNLWTDRCALLIVGVARGNHR